MKLHKAIENNDLKKVRELLAAGTPADERDKDGMTPLMVAITYQMQNLVKVLLEAGADVAAIDSGGENALHYAATYATPTILKMLLAKQPDVNSRNASGETPLIITSSTAMAQLLIDAGADVNIRRSDGLTALDICECQRKFNNTKESKLSLLLREAGASKEPAAPPAPAPLVLPPRGTGPLASPTDQDIASFLEAAQRDEPVTLRRMLEAGMLIDVRSDLGNTALHLASMRGCLASVQLLLEARPDLNARDGAGWTALHHAAQNDRAAVASALLAAGFEVDAHSGTRSTPLMVAAEQNAVEVARVLLQGGAAVNVRNAPGQTPFKLARSSAMRQLLRDAGADDKVARPLSASAAEMLVQAASDGDLDRVRELLDSGVPANASIRNGHTALRGAAQHGHLQILQVLLEAGGDPHLPGESGDTLVGGAVWGANAELVRYLIGLGIDVNAGDRHGFTPLMTAAMQGYREVAEVLLAAGADRNARGSFGLDRNKTALQYARQCEDRKQRQAMIELLSGEAATADPVESAFQGVSSFHAAAEQPAFQAMVRVLAEVCDKPPTQVKKIKGAYTCTGLNATRLAARYGDDAELQAALKEVRSAAARAKHLVERLQTEVRAAGFQLIEAEANQSPRFAKLLLFPTGDKYAVIAARQTDGANYGHSTQDIVAWLNEMERENPFVLTACGHDFLAGEFVNPVVHAGGLAERMCRFCPDLLDGDEVESAEQVAEYLKEQQGFFFWWD